MASCFEMQLVAAAIFDVGNYAFSHRCVLNRSRYMSTKIG